MKRMLNNVYALVAASMKKIQLDDDADAWTFDTLFDFVTPAFIEVFDNAYDKMIAPKLCAGYLFRRDGSATDTGLDAYIRYCDEVRRSFRDEYALDVPRNGKPPALQSKFIVAVQDCVMIQRYKISGAEVRGLDVPFSRLVPWFSERAAEDFMQLAYQCAPGISMVSLGPPIAFDNRASPIHPLVDIANFSLSFLSVLLPVAN